ncbi:hypothetical protein RUM44_000753 [Polyplax serrata]|uniref:Peroxisome assembly protein 12 n=1 Tax=Polyplax serrata TaxID=468196 RepID=A0ABR1B737_POLSC
MAEIGAHLSPTTGIKPSIFDFMAQEGLNELLYPVFHKIANALGPHYIVTNFTDIYYMLYLGTQALYLKTFGATFSEKFYGMKRVPLNKPNTGSIGNKIVLLSLAVEVLTPYLIRRINEIHEKYSDEQNQNKKKTFWEVTNYISKTLCMAAQTLKIIYHVRYLSGSSDISSPELWFAGVKLKYADETSAHTNQITLKNFMGKILPGLFGCGMFFVQFLQWWETNRTYTINTDKVPPPPPLSQNKNETTVCPVCHKTASIETALATSGYVFCFLCISSYVQKHKKCPVTGLPSTVDHLIHIYAQTRCSKNKEGEQKEIIELEETCVLALA